MKRSALALAVCLLLLSSCGPASTGGAPVTGHLEGLSARSVYDDPVWQDLIAAARAEGRVVVAVNPNPDITEQLPAAFRERFGVDVELIAGRSGDLMSRLESERTAGLSTVDVVIAGGDSGARLYQNGWLQPLRPVLIAPGVADPSRWLDGQLPFLDPEDQTILQLERTVVGVWFVNPDVVTDSDLRTLDDVLDPRWKGRISMDDITTAGLGQNNAVYIYLTRGEEFFRRLYVDQAPVFSREDRQIEDWLVRGVYPISFGLAVKNLEELRSMGLPIKNVGTLGGGGWVRGPSVSFLANAPHPSAARLFLNWIASPDGLRFHAEAEKMPPARTDVPHPWVTGPEQVPVPGRTYAMNADAFEYTTAKKPPIMSRIREIVGR